MVVMRVLFVLSVGLQASGVPPASQRQDFQGTWILESKPVSTPGVEPVCGKQCTIRQDSIALTVQSGGQTTKFPFDGSSAERSVATQAYVTTVRTKAAWDGDVLVTELQIGESSSSGLMTKARLSIQSGRLIIEGTRPALGGGEAPFKSIYRRSPSGD